MKKNATLFEYLKTALNLSHNDFMRTSVNSRHRSGVAKLWQACVQNGDVYQGTYRGLYCVGCEHFYRESDLENGRCPEHLVRPAPICEENHFFRLSRYRDERLSLVRSDELLIVPSERRNEVLRWLERGLEDISVSRSRQHTGGWSIPVLDDPGQVIYVWFDALGNYISALDYGGDQRLFEKYWC